MTHSSILDIVAGSVVEGEYGAAYFTTRNIVWLRRVAYTMDHPQSAATPLYVKNTTAVGIANKVLQIYRHEILLVARLRSPRTNPSPSSKQPADFFTKDLPIWQHFSMMTKFCASTQPLLSIYIALECVSNQINRLTVPLILALTINAIQTNN